MFFLNALIEYYLLILRVSNSKSLVIFLCYSSAWDLIFIVQASMCIRNYLQKKKIFYAIKKHLEKKTLIQKVLIFFYIGT